MERRKAWQFFQQGLCGGLKIILKGLRSVLQMKIFDYFESEMPEWIDKIRACDWSAAKFLADLLDQNRFHEILGMAVCSLWQTAKGWFPL